MINKLTITHEDHKGNVKNVTKDPSWGATVSIGYDFRVLNISRNKEVHCVQVFHENVEFPYNIAFFTDKACANAAMRILETAPHDSQVHFPYNKYFKIYYKKQKFNRKISETTLGKELSKIVSPDALEANVNAFNNNIYARTKLSVEDMKSIIDGTWLPSDWKTFATDLGVILEKPSNFNNLCNQSTFWFALVKQQANEIAINSGN